MERRVVTQLRELLETPLALEQAAIGVFGKLQEAQRASAPEPAQLYREAMGALGDMSEASSRDDAAGRRAGFERFAACVERLDQLLQTHSD